MEGGVFCCKETQEIIFPDENASESHMRARVNILLQNIKLCPDPGQCKMAKYLALHARTDAVKSERNSPTTSQIYGT